MLTLLVIASAGAPTPSVEAGEALFNRIWTEAEGLGPRYNAASCAACHAQAGVGGSGSNDHNVQLLPESGVLHRFSTEPGWDEQRRATLTPDLSHAHCGFAVSHALDRATPRNRQTPALFGIGQLAQVSVAELRAAATQGALIDPTVSGRIAITTDGSPGRFGWKGQTSTLPTFVRDACTNELGLEDMAPTDLASLASYVESLPAPRATAGDPAVFEAIGCGACHPSELGAVRGAYTDLLLHDLGPELADGMLGYGQPDDTEAEVATAGEWRTPPLWGLGH